MPTVLIVDDSLSVRKVAERTLKEAGMDVVLAANGDAAIAWLSTHQPDLVIADVIMPDRSGFEICAFVRAQAHMTNTPVLLFSGFVDDDVTRQAEACKADGVVKKPFQGASLCGRVMALLAARAPQGVRAESSVLESPVPATEAAVMVHAAPLIPAEEAVAAPAPVDTGQEERRLLRETIQRLGARVAQQEQELARLEQSAQDLRQRLEDEAKHRVELRARLTDLEPAVDASTRALRALEEFARHMLKSSEQGRPEADVIHDADESSSA